MSLLIAALAMASWAAISASYLVWIVAFPWSQYHAFFCKYWWKLQNTDDHYDVVATCKKRAWAWIIGSCVILYPAAFLLSCAAALLVQSPLLAILIFPFVTMTLFFFLRKTVGAGKESGPWSKALRFSGAAALLGAACMIASGAAMLGAGNL